jgi:hypothetical protein
LADQLDHVLDEIFWLSMDCCFIEVIQDLRNIVNGCTFCPAIPK